MNDIPLWPQYVNSKLLYSNFRDNNTNHTIVLET